MIGRAFTFLLVSAVVHAAADVPPGFLFDELPGPNAPIAFDRMTGLPVRGTINSTIRISGRGQICLLNASGSPSDPIFPFDAGFLGPVDFAFGAMNGDGLVPDFLLAGPAEPADRPMVAYALGNPTTRLGDTPVPGVAAGGMRTAIGNVFGDRTPEIVVALGPGAPGQVNVIAINTTDVITFEPFGPDFTGGVSVAIGDVNHDGIGEVLTAQERGGELKVFEMVGNEAREIGRGRPYGHGFSGGIRVAAFDLNNDDIAEIITSAIAGPPQVRVFDVSNPANIAVAGEFVAFEQERPGGVSVAAGLTNGRPFVLATSGRNVRMFDVNDQGRFTRVAGFSENPFQLFIDIFLDVDTFTPPPPQ